jgi:hypothetical protein
MLGGSLAEGARDAAPVTRRRRMAVGLPLGL